MVETFPEWISAHDGDWDGPLGPHLADPATWLSMRSADRKQAGALTQPLLSYGLDPDQHFQAALARGQFPLPTGQPPVMDLDLQFAATLTGALRGKLRDWHTHAVGALRELHRRWACVGPHLKKAQPASLRATTQQRDLGLQPCC